MPTVVVVWIKIFYVALSNKYVAMRLWYVDTKFCTHETYSNLDIMLKASQTLNNIIQSSVIPL